MSKTNDEFFMRKAISLAKKAQWPFGCVIVINDEIVSEAKT